MNIQYFIKASGHKETNIEWSHKSDNQ